MKNGLPTRPFALFPRFGVSGIAQIGLAILPVFRL